VSPSLLVGTDTGLTRVLDTGEAVPVLTGRSADALGAGDDRWVVLDGRVVARSDDGTAWTEVTATDGLRANCVLVATGQVWVGASEARLLRLVDGSLEPVAAFDRVEGHEAWHTPWGGPPDVRSLSASPDGSALYANVHVGGIVRSRDGGASWEPTIDIGADVHQVLAHPEDPAVVLAASARGLELSTDGGGGWTTHTDGLHATYARAVAAAGNSVLLSASTGPFTRHAAVYRAPLDPAGVSFERCADGLPEWFTSNVDSGCLAATGAEVASGTDDGRVFRSSDAGVTWAVAAEGLGAVRAVLFGPD
jgi:hypothetical protein